MRKAIAGTALLTAAVLLTGCGSSGSDAKDTAKKDVAAKPSTTPTTGKWGEPETHDVTLEVQGKGTPSVMWIAGTNDMEQVTLPWKKTTKVTLKGAELKLGSLISVQSQGVPGPNGRYVFPPCVIKVDGKTVAQNDDGEDSKGCKYELKGSG